MDVNKSLELKETARVGAGFARGRTLRRVVEQKFKVGGAVREGKSAFGGEGNHGQAWRGIGARIARSGQKGGRWGC